MKTILLILSLILFGAPAMAAEFPDFDRTIIVAANTPGKQRSNNQNGKVVIKGKGGTVTDVQQQQEKRRKEEERKERKRSK